MTENANRCLRMMRTLNLAAQTDPLLGTIELADVLDVLTQLDEACAGNEDLFIEAAERARNARSAGEEHIDPHSVFGARRSSTRILLRHRGEMADAFIDLAIDLAKRELAATTVNDEKEEEVPA